MERFEQLVRDAMNEVPEPFAASLAEIVVTVEACASSDDYPHGLYGLYVGESLGDRYSFSPPRQIIIYCHPMVDHWPQEDGLRQQIRVTLLHELGHFYGMDHHDLDRLGYL